LPKRRRISFVIECYDSGVCIGVCFFSSTLKTFHLTLGENCIEPRLYISEAFNHRINAGPLPQYEYATRDWREVQARQEAIIALEEEYTSAMEQLAALHYCLDSHAKVQLEDVLVLKILKYKNIQDQLRTRAVLGHELAAQRGRVLFDTPLEPGYCNVRMGSSILRLTHADIKHLDLCYQEEVQPLINAEIALRRKVKTIGYVWTRPAAMQELVLRLKCHSTFLKCNECSTKVYRPGCECVSEWLEHRLLGAGQGHPFQGCQVCRAFDETINPCTCHENAAAEIQAELDAFEDGGQGPACVLCLNMRSCQCPMLALIEHTEGDLEAYDEISEYFTPRSVTEVTESLSSRDISVVNDSSSHDSPPLAPPVTQFKTAVTHATTAATRPELRVNHPFYGRTGRPTPQVQAEKAASGATGKNADPPASASEQGSMAGIPSITDESEMSLATVSEPVHSLGSIHEVLDGSSICLEELAIGDMTEPVSDQDVSGTDLACLMDSEPSLTGIQPGHLSRAYQRSQDYDPMQAATTETNYKHPEPKRVQGYAKIPAGFVPFNGDIEGDVHGVPKTYEERGVDGNYKENISTPALYQSSILATDSASTTSTMKDRYTVVRADGTRHCPRGTLNKVLTDILGAPPVEAPQNVPEFLLAGPTGFRVYQLCQPASQSTKKEEPPAPKGRLALKIRSLKMEEPTDVPPESRRNWMHKVIDAESHGNNPLEISLQFTGQLSLQSHSWEEVVLPDGRRGLKSMNGGKSAGTFTLSCGSSRGENFKWPLKLGARWLVVLLCGGGKRMSKSAFLASKLEAVDISSLRNAQDAAKPLVSDESEGSGPDSKTIDPKCDWRGFGFCWRSHGFDVDYGHRVTLTLGDCVPLDTLNAIYGLHYWAVSHFSAIKARYEEMHRARGRKLSDRQLERCFGPLRFSIAALDPKWSRFVPLVSRILGSDWKDQLERLLYALNDDDYDVLFHYSSTVGPFVSNFLGEEKQFPEVFAEQIGRIDDAGRAIYLEEEQDGIKELRDHGHHFAEKTLHERACMSLKAYGTAEFARTESL
ncbi:unnamed protein product, partial [Oikopleura dioica]